MCESASERVERRKRSILALVRKEKCVLLNSIKVMLYSEEKNIGVETMIDRKTVARIVAELEEGGLVWTTCISKTPCDVDDNHVYTIVCDESIQSEEDKKFEDFVRAFLIPLATNYQTNRSLIKCSNDEAEGYEEDEDGGGKNSIIPNGGRFAPLYGYSSKFQRIHGVQTFPNEDRIKNLHKLVLERYSPKCRQASSAHSLFKDPDRAHRLVTELPLKLKRSLTRNRRYMFHIDQIFKLLSSLKLVRFVKSSACYKQHSVVQVLTEVVFKNTLIGNDELLSYHLRTWRDVEVMWCELAECALNDANLKSFGNQHVSEANENTDVAPPLGLDRDLFIWYRSNWGVNGTSKKITKFLRILSGGDGDDHVQPLTAPLSSPVIKTYINAQTAYFRLEKALDLAIQPLLIIGKKRCGTLSSTSSQSMVDPIVQRAVERNRLQRAIYRRQKRSLRKTINRRKIEAVPLVTKRKNPFLPTELRVLHCVRAMMALLEFRIERYASETYFDSLNVRDLMKVLLPLADPHSLRLSQRIPKDIRIRLQASDVRKGSLDLHAQMLASERFRTYRSRLLKLNNKFCPWETAQMCAEFCKTFRSELVHYIETGARLATKSGAQLIADIHNKNNQKEKIDKHYVIHRKQTRSCSTHFREPFEHIRDIHSHVIETNVKSLLCMPPAVRAKNVKLARDLVLLRFDLQRSLPHIMNRLTQVQRFVSIAKSPEHTTQGGDCLNIMGRFYKLSCRFDLRFCCGSLSSKVVRCLLPKDEQTEPINFNSACSHEPETAIRVSKAVASNLSCSLDISNPIHIEHKPVYRRKTLRVSPLTQLDGNADDDDDDDDDDVPQPTRRLSSRKRTCTSFVGMDEDDKDSEDPWNEKKRSRANEDVDFVPSGSRPRTQKNKRSKKHISSVCDKITAILTKANQVSRGGRPPYLYKIKPPRPCLNESAAQLFLSGNRIAKVTSSRPLLSYSINEQDGRLVKYRPIRYRPFRRKDIIVKVITGKMACFRDLDFGDEFMRMLVCENNLVLETPFSSGNGEEMSTDEKLKWEVRQSMERILLNVTGGALEYVSIDEKEEPVEENNDKKTQSIAALNEEIVKVVDAILADKIDCSTFVDYIVHSKDRLCKYGVTSKGAGNSYILPNVSTTCKQNIWQPSASYVKLQMKYAPSASTIKCMLCQKPFTNRVCLKRHMVNHHSEFMPVSQTSSLFRLKHQQQQVQPTQLSNRNEQSENLCSFSFKIPSSIMQNCETTRAVSRIVMNRTLRTLITMDEVENSQKLLETLSCQHQDVFRDIDNAGPCGTNNHFSHSSQLLNQLVNLRLVYKLGVDRYVSNRNAIEWANPLPTNNEQQRDKNELGNLMDIAPKTSSSPETTTSKSYVIAKPWLLMNGNVCLPIIRMFSEAVMLHILSRPGVNTATIHSDLTAPFLTMTDTIEILKFLEHMNCVHCSKPCRSKELHPFFNESSTEEEDESSELTEHNNKSNWNVSKSGTDIFATIFDDNQYNGGEFSDDDECMNSERMAEITGGGYSLGKAKNKLDAFLSHKIGGSRNEDDEEPM